MGRTMQERAALRRAAHTLRGQQLPLREIGRRLSVSPRHLIRLLSEPAPSRNDTDDPRWMWAGLCRRVDPELFFPPSGNSAAGRRAKEVCAACQVQQRCKQWALDRPEEHGIWGGTTKRERRQLRKQLKESA